jgi:hypothetical protein
MFFERSKNKRSGGGGEFQFSNMAIILFPLKKKKKKIGKCHFVFFSSIYFVFCKESTYPLISISF